MMSHQICGAHFPERMREASQISPRAESASSVARCFMEDHSCDVSEISLYSSRHRHKAYVFTLAILKP